MAKILVVEDSLELLEMLKLLLNMNGYEVRLVGDENNVHNSITSFSPELILLDVWLNNKKSGRELCAEIKKNDKAIPVILMSANPELLHDYEECNADAVIEKPFDIKLLDKTISRLLQIPR